jgi:regulation of enolase protein 1 (concanavalin A-like superfamily)
MTVFSVPGLPAPLEWRIPPLDWRWEPPTGLTIAAGARTDWFSDPAGGSSIDNAPAALFAPPDTDFRLSAKVTVVELASAFDAGVIQVRERGDLWAKLCFEVSPQRQPMVVSVVTRGVSDDANHAAIEGNVVHLRVARRADTFAFHFSADGRMWHLVRYFSLGKLSDLRIGFSSQSPTGSGCTAVFSEITYQPGALADIRSGE